MKLLCWDIDGTLLDTGGAGRLAWQDAVEEGLGRAASLRRFATAGLTDIQIARLFARELFPNEELEQRLNWLLERYTQHLPKRLSSSAGGVLPNVLDILRSVASRGDLVSALLTGNVQAGARVKLDCYGLWSFFEWGAFADGTADRPEIARRALATAHARHAGAGFETVYVIGDTALDIECGRAIGARTIAVGTGPYSAAELARHGPWWALDRLPEPREFLGRLAAAS
jgi:phosphoglycolate phosphatase-like HAD superfamily hydrolase